MVGVEKGKGRTRNRRFERGVSTLGRREFGSKSKRERNDFPRSKTVCCKFPCFSFLSGRFRLNLSFSLERFND